QFLRRQTGSIFPSRKPRCADSSARPSMPTWSGSGAGFDDPHLAAFAAAMRTKHSRFCDPRSGKRNNGPRPALSSNPRRELRDETSPDLHDSWSVIRDRLHGDCGDDLAAHFGARRTHGIAEGSSVSERSAFSSFVQSPAGTLSSTWSKSRILYTSTEMIQPTAKTPTIR